jgi:hypothetical protein
MKTAREFQMSVGSQLGLKTRVIPKPRVFSGWARDLPQIHLEGRSFAPSKNGCTQDDPNGRQLQFSDEEEGLTNHLKVTVFALGGAGRLLHELEELT